MENNWIKDESVAFDIDGVIEGVEYWNLDSKEIEVLLIKETNETSTLWCVSCCDLGIYREEVQETGTLESAQEIALLIIKTRATEIFNLLCK